MPYIEITEAMVVAALEALDSRRRDAAAVGRRDTVTRADVRAALRAAAAAAEIRTDPDNTPPQVTVVFNGDESVRLAVDGPPYTFTPDGHKPPRVRTVQVGRRPS